MSLRVHCVGEVISASYFDFLCSEIASMLASSGSVSLSALAQDKQLPNALLREHIDALIAAHKLHDATMHGDYLYTTTFVHAHNQKVSGILAACTQPTTIRALINRYALLEQLTTSTHTHTCTHAHMC